MNKPADAATAHVTNFIRNVIEADLAGGKYASRTWGGAGASGGRDASGGGGGASGGAGASGVPGGASGAQGASGAPGGPSGAPTSASACGAPSAAGPAPSPPPWKGS